VNIASAPSFTTLYAMSDVHGHLTEMKNLLVAAGLVDASSQFPGTVHWTGGDATLVITGDMIDKGPSSLDVIETAMALESAATAAKGTVLVLFGNHEAEFIGTPTGSKFTGKDTIDNDLGALAPPVAPADFASGKDPRGAWLRKRPFAAIVGMWFFSHAGNTNGATLAALDLTLGAALAGSGGFTDPAIVGTTSLLEARDWYTSTSVVDQNLMALGAHHIVMGHDPNAFSSQGSIVMPATFAGKLFKIDTGLGSGYSNGEILRVRHDGADDVAESLLPNGTVKALYRGAP
jgi:hypothetical protein